MNNYLYGFRFVQLIAIFLLISAIAGAEVPGQVSYQGKLTDADGLPLNGTFSMTFTIYDAPAGGTALWTETQPSVNAAEGFFSTQLGSVAPLDETVFLNSELYLGIAVAGDPEQSPRRRFTNMPWSFHSAVADSVAGGPFVKAAGDTVNGDLAVMGNFSAGTDSIEAPITLRTHSNWRWDIGNGLGDIRIGDGIRGLSIGISSGGGGAGHVHFWPSGGSQLMTFGSPVSGDQLTIDGNYNHIWTGSRLSVGTDSSLAPLTVRSADNWRWDIGTGNGDFRLATAAGIGLSIGIAGAGGGAGAVRFWPSGGTVEDMLFGSPGFGDIFEVIGTGDVNFRSTDTRWLSGGVQRLRVNSDSAQIVICNPAGNMRGRFSSFSNSGDLQILNDNGNSTISMFGGGPNGGNIFMWRDDFHISGAFDGGSSADVSGGNFYLYDGTGSFSPTMSFHGATTGDAAVNLPQGAISSTEIFDEPGIASNRENGITVLNSSTTMQDLTTVDISVPAAGYVFLYGHCWVEVYGTTSSQGGYIQIDENAGGDIEAPYHTFSGNSAYSSTLSHWWSTSNQRVYQVYPGDYTFRLEGKRWSNNGTAEIWHPVLTALFFPTSYGPVSTFVSSSETSEFESAIPSASPVDDSPHAGATSAQYKVDLRELELRAQRLQHEAEKARLELEAAQLRRQLTERDYSAGRTNGGID